MTIIQDSASVDIKAAAELGAANGFVLSEIGLVRAEFEKDEAMTVRVRRQWSRQPFGPDAFVPATNTLPNASFRIIEGGTRGGNEWQEAFLTARDWSTTIWGTQVDARVIVSPDGSGSVEPATINAWIQKGPSRQYETPNNTFFAIDLPTWRAFIQSLQVDLSIPPDATSVLMNAPTTVANAVPPPPTIAMPYPFSIVQVDPFGNLLDEVVFAAADNMVHEIVLDPQARWIAPINAALVGGFFPFHVVYRRH